MVSIRRGFMWARMSVATKAMPSDEARLAPAMAAASPPTVRTPLASGRWRASPGATTTAVSGNPMPASHASAPDGSATAIWS
jgi:hypothetical protein